MDEAVSNHATTGRQLWQEGLEDDLSLVLAKVIGAFRVELLDQEPVIPIGVVTTQPDRSPMFMIRPR